MKGVLDRIEDGIAVVLVHELNAEFTLRAEDLPSESEVGTWYHIAKTAGEFTILSIDERETIQAKKKTQLLMKKLQKKKQGSKFKR